MKAGTALGAIAVIGVLAIFAYIAAPQYFVQQSVSPENSQAPQPLNKPVGSQPFAAQLTVNVVLRDTLDPSETRTEATNLATTYYKKASNSPTGYSSIGSGTGNTITIGTDMDSKLYFTHAIVSGQAYFVDAKGSATSDKNPRITAYEFVDVTGDGLKEWLFTVDLHDMPPPMAGQTASTLSLYLDSFDDGATTLNAPADISSIGTTAGTQTFIRWEQTVGAETVDPVYEYELKANSTNTAKWTRGQAIITIPGIGDKALDDFAESQDGTSTFYKLNLGNTLKGANYVSTPQNGNTVHPIPFKLVSNYATSDKIVWTLTIRSLTAAQGTASVNDAVQTNA